MSTISAPDVTRPTSPPRAPARTVAARPPVPPATRASAAARALVTDVARHHADELLRHAMRVSTCADDAHDAYQRTLELMLQHAHEIDRAKAIGWAYTVIGREARRLARQRSEVLPLHDQLVEAPHAGGTADDAAETIDIARRAQEVLATLPESQSQAVCLRAQGLTYEEIAGELGWSNRKVKRAVHEGRRDFARRYEALAAGAVCEAAGRTIPNYLAGTLNARQTIQLRAHLARCPGCRAAMHAQRGDAALRALLPPALLVAAGESGQRRGWIADHLLSPLDHLLHRSSGAIEQLGTAKLGAVAASTVAITGTGVVAHDRATPQPPPKVRPALTAAAANPTTTAAAGATDARVVDVIGAAVHRQQTLDRRAARRRAAERRKAARQRQREAATREFAPAATEFSQPATTTNTSGGGGSETSAIRNSDTIAADPPSASAPQEVTSGGGDSGGIDVVTESQP